MKWKVIFKQLIRKYVSKSFCKWEKEKIKRLGYLTFIYYLAYCIYWILNIINKNKDIFILINAV